MDDIDTINKSLLKLRNSNVILSSEHNKILEIIDDVKNRLFDIDCVIIEQNDYEEIIDDIPKSNKQKTITKKYPTINCECNYYVNKCLTLESLSKCMNKDKYIKTFPKISYLIDKNNKIDKPMTRSLVIKTCDRDFVSSNIRFLVDLCANTKGKKLKSIVILITFNYILENWHFVLSHSKFKKSVIGKFVELKSGSDINYIYEAEEFLNEKGIFDLWYGWMEKFMYTT